MSWLVGGLLAALTLTWPSVAPAAPVFWTDWTSASAGSATGTLTVGSSTIGVGYAGGHSFVQASGGTNFWSPSGPYLSAAVDNEPPAADIIALGAGGVAIVTFSEPVVDPLIALVSWNGNSVDFGEPIEFLSFGCGFWGCGTPIGLGVFGFLGIGEVHGVIRLAGPHTSFGFAHTSEEWHGFTVGVAGLAEPPPPLPPPSGVPAPATAILLGLGAIALAPIRRHRVA